MPDDQQQSNQLTVQAGAPTLFPELMDYIRSVASGDRLVQSLQEQFPSGPNPLDVGVKAAVLDPQMLDAAANLALGMAGNMTRPAWHGTPHVFAAEEGAPFGRFSNEAIGSGEGAQAYGYGHYVAGNKRVAEDYQKNLAQTPRVYLNGRPVYDTMGPIGDALYNEPEHIELAAEALHGKDGDVEAAIKQLGIDKAGQTDFVKPEYDNAIDFLRDSDNKMQYQRDLGGGALLEVHVLPEEHELLDWDKPLSEQSPSVQQIVRPFIEQSIAKQEAAKAEQLARGTDAFGRPFNDRRLTQLQSPPADIDNMTGEDIYKRWGLPARDQYEGAKNASAALHAAGIPGIKYLDAGSRRYEVMQRPQMLSDDPAAWDVMSRGSLVSSHLTQAEAEQAADALRTHNYVIFDPSNLRIVGRNGERLEPIDHDPFAPQGGSP